MQLGGIGATAKEIIPGLEWFDNFQCIEELAEFIVDLDFLVPLAFPNDFGIITSLSHGVLFDLRGLVDFLQGAVSVTDGISVTLARKALCAPVPKIPIEFVHSGTVGDRIAGVVPVHQVSVRHTHFASVSDSADAIACGRVLLSQLKRLVIKGDK